MDRRKGYVLLLINAGVRNSVSERKKSWRLIRTTKNQLPFLSIIEIKQNPTNLFNYFIYKSYKNTSIIRL